MWLLLFFFVLSCDRMSPSAQGAEGIDVVLSNREGLGSSLTIPPMYVQVSPPATWGSIHQETVAIAVV